MLWTVAVWMVALSVMSYVGRTAMAIAGPEIIREFGLTETQMGTVHMRSHPLWVFFALLGGVQAFGVIGLFVGPAVLALAQSLFSLVRAETHTQTDKPGRIASEQTARQA